MGTLELTRGRQALELRSNLSERRALTDPICSSGRAESSARNLQWAKAHGVCQHRDPSTTSTKASCWGCPMCHPECHPSAVRDQSGVTALLAVPAVLPESRQLRFDCGVTVQLGFAAEFSNIMIIYTRVLAAPGHIAECVARLTDLPEVGRLLQRGSTWGWGVPQCCPPS